MNTNIKENSRAYWNINCVKRWVRIVFICFSFFYCSNSIDAQVSNALRSGFTWIPTEDVTDKTYGSGYTLYSSAWPIFKDYPGSSSFQMGLAGCWMTTQRTGNEPDQFYTTIEGGLGWWRDTRFGTEIPKFIMGGVSHNFYAWANGPGAGRSATLSNGQRDWSTPGGKYGVAQLSNRLLWAPDGLNMAQSLNGEMLGYGYTPLPITDPLAQTNGQEVQTGNQCWTLFLNSTNFKGPATFFLPTFWTRPVLDDPSLEGLFLDSRPSEPNVGFGVEHAESPAILSFDENDELYAKQARLQYPAIDEDNSMLLNQITVYSQNTIWDDMISWFDGGSTVPTGSLQFGSRGVSIVNNGGSMAAEIRGLGLENSIELDYIENTQQTSNIMGYKFNLDKIERTEDHFLMPEYFRLGADDRWYAIDEEDVPISSNLVEAEVPLSQRPEITYLTPLDLECQWQDPTGPWNSPGPAAGPFTSDLGDGSTVTYYWYRFVDQPSIVHANFPEDIREKMQARIELLHSNWSHKDEYLAPPEIGTLATVDPAAIVQPPAGMEVGYVPIVTRQEKTKKKVRVFVLAGQSNMEGFGTVVDPEGDPGSLTDVIENDEDQKWSVLGEPGAWKAFDDAYLYFANDGDTIRTNVTVGQGNNSNLIGVELMFADQLDKYFDDPVLIVKTAWGGKSLAVDFRPPSAGGLTGPFYSAMIETVKGVTQNIGVEFPEIGETEFEISGFAWFQGWNDGASDDYLNEYESNLNHLIQDVRNDLAVPNLPFVIANSGHGGLEQSNDLWVQSMQNIVSVAQENVGCNDSIYGGRVGFVNTKPYYKDVSESPLDAIHHFNNNALTFLNIGKAIGKEMVLGINDMAYCYTDCEDQIAPGIMSIGNRVWNDLNQDGIQDLEEPGIPGVSLVIWSDSDGDDIPDWQGFGGVRVTDEEGYYQFSGLQPGNYSVFVWSLDNWDPGEPLEGFQSTNGFVSNADNDVDMDNNGSGNPFTDIFAGIVTLTPDEEPLGDGDPFHCYFNYDGSGNNTVDFGFFDPNVTSTEDVGGDESWVRIFPNPAKNKITVEGNMNHSTIELYDSVGTLIHKGKDVQSKRVIDISTLPQGIYIIKVLNESNNQFQVQKVVKQ